LRAAEPHLGEGVRGLVADRFLEGDPRVVEESTVKRLDAGAQLFGGSDGVEIYCLGGKQRGQAQKADEQRSQFHETSIEKSGVRIYRVLCARVELDLSLDAEVQDRLDVVRLDDGQLSSLGDRHCRKSNAINLHWLTPAFIFDQKSAGD
jgi:hypothetical protein